MAKLHLPSNANVMDGPSKFAQVWHIFFDGLATAAGVGGTTATQAASTAATVTAAAAVAPVASPDAAVAPAAYDQAHIDTIVAELNETKAQLNALLAALNT